MCLVNAGTLKRLAREQYDTAAFAAAVPLRAADLRAVVRVSFDCLVSPDADLGSAGACHRASPLANVEI